MRKARNEKLDLEHSFFLRVDAIMSRMSNIFHDENFTTISATDK